MTIIITFVLQVNMIPHIFMWFFVGFLIFEQKHVVLFVFLIGMICLIAQKIAPTRRMDALSVSVVTLYR